jgi:hypothetical protein
MLAQNRAAQEKTAVIGSGICGSVIFCAKYLLFYLLALSRLLVHFFAFFFISWGYPDVEQQLCGKGHWRPRYSSSRECFTSAVMHEDSNPVVVAGVENKDSRLFSVMPHPAIWGEGGLWRMQMIQRAVTDCGTKGPDIFCV